MEKDRILSKNVHQKISFFLTALISFNLAFKYLVPILIALLMLNWIFDGRFKERFNKKENRNFFFLFSSFYLAHILALVYTNNVQEGMTNLEVKLTIFLFPLFFFTTHFTTEQLRKIVMLFILGCASAAGICLIRAGWIWYSTGENNFFYESFSWFMHPSYFSMYINLAIFFLLRSFFITENNSRTNRNISVLLLFFLTFTILLLSSKLGIISYLILSAILLFTELIKRKRFKLLIAITALGLMGIFSAYKLSETLRTRFNYMFSAVKTEQIDKSNMESSAVRILIWEEANKLIARHPVLGVSPGDTNDHLYKAYEANGLTGALQNRLNAHNQYYQTAIGLGIIGALLLIAQFIFPFVHAVKKKKTVYLLFILLIAMNFLVESMLQTQAGVIFYAFFNSLFLFHRDIEITTLIPVKKELN